MLPWSKCNISTRYQKSTNIFLSRHFSGGYTPGMVMLSKSRDIYRNLAFEDWIYKNICFKNMSPGILLMWCNRPAVVIGRHQNPWIECNQKLAKEKGINLARRNSGGGTVYHDDGNLNCSFVTSRSDYNRKDNLNVICAALQKKWNFDVSISNREDIVLQKVFKISGTASKLGSQNAYHHCTVLVSAESQTLKEVLNRNLDGITSKATESVKSKIKNLRELCPNLSVEDVSSEISWQYQESHKIQNKRIVSVYPNEENFPGINNIIDHLKSWEWVYGWTPRFTVSRRFTIDNNSNFLFSNVNDSTNSSILVLEISIYRGLIERVCCTPYLTNSEAYSALQDCLKGTRFTCEDILSAVKTWTAKYSEYEIIEKLIMKTAEKAIM